MAQFLNSILLIEGFIDLNWKQQVIPDQHSRDYTIHEAASL